MGVSVNEISRLKQWIYGVLVNDPVIAAAVGVHPVYGVPQVYDRIAPEKSTYPLITYQFIPEADKRGGFGARLFSQGALLVKAINTGTDESGIWPIADAFDSDLQDAVAMATATGLIVMGCTRDLMHNQATVDEGLQYNELGGRYTVQFYVPGVSVPGQSSAGNLPPSITVQAQLDSLTQQIGLLSMAVHTLSGARYAVGTPITATATLTAQSNSTSYGVNTTAAAIILTLPLATGSNTDLEFIRTAGGFNATFVLSGSDTVPGGLTNTPLANIGDVQAFRDIAAGVWEAH